MACPSCCRNSLPTCLLPPMSLLTLPLQLSPSTSVFHSCSSRLHLSPYLPPHSTLLLQSLPFYDICSPTPSVLAIGFLSAHHGYHRSQRWLTASILFMLPLPFGPTDPVASAACLAPVTGGLPPFPTVSSLSLLSFHITETRWRAQPSSRRGTASTLNPQAARAAPSIADGGEAVLSGHVCASGLLSAM